MIQNISKENKTTSPPPNFSSVGLSYSPYLKKGLFNKNKKSTNPDYDCVPDTKDEQFWEYSEGSTWCRISNEVIDPFTTKDIIGKVIPKRRKISYFSRKSRNRLLQLVSKLNKSKVDPKSVLFITLTSPSVGWLDVSGEQWKKRLNNFLTQLRQKFKCNDTFCGIWRQEFQKRGSPHFHIVTYNVPYIDHEWISTKWNKICCKGLSFREQQKHLAAGTQVQVAREWGEINDYFSKTMSYVCKDEHWKHEKNLSPNVLQYMKTFGRHWGVINRSNLDKLTDLVVGKFQQKKQYYQVKRTFKKYIESIKKKKLGWKYNSKVSRTLHKIFTKGDKRRFNVFMNDGGFKKLLLLYGVNIKPLGNDVEFLPSRH